MERNLINFLHKCNPATINKVIESEEYVLLIDELMRNTNRDIENRAIVCNTCVVTKIDFYNGGSIFVHVKSNTKDKYIILTDHYTTNHLRIYKKANLSFLTKIYEHE